MVTSSGIKHRIRHIKPKSSPQNPVADTECAIFFIHGVGGSSDIWTAQLTYFSQQGYHVIAPDLVGHGFTSAPNDSKCYSFERICRDLIEIFDRFYQDETTIVAHSYGTSFATFLAHSRPSRVHLLVLMSGGAPVSLTPEFGLLSLPIPILTCMKPALQRVFYRNAFYKRSKNLLNKRVAFDIPIYVLRHVMKGQVWQEGDEEFHRTIYQPTLLLHGESDQLESHENTEFMTQVLPHSEFCIIPKAGHMIMMEQPDTINSLVQRFLKGSVWPSEDRNATPQSITHHRLKHATHKSQPNIRALSSPNH